MDSNHGSRLPSPRTSAKRRPSLRERAIASETASGWKVAPIYHAVSFGPKIVKNTDMKTRLPGPAWGTISLNFRADHAGLDVTSMPASHGCHLIISQMPNAAL